MPASTNNEIILIGGHVGAQVMEYLATKVKGEIGIITFAQESGVEEYLKGKRAQFAEFGCEVRHVQSKDDLVGLSAVLYAGGDQNLLYARLKETGLHLDLMNSWRKGEVILAGSSAGAMVLCGVMLDVPDMGFGQPGRPNDLTYGLGPLGACFVVAHFSEATTPEWQSELIERHGEGYYIFGIDENTAMVWRAGKCKVIGRGGVHARGRMTGDWRNGEEFEIARGW